MSSTVKPIVLDLGKQSRKKLKHLKHGQGPLLQEVLESMDQIRATLGSEAEGKVLQPVVVMYERKAKVKGGGKIFGIF